MAVVIDEMESTVDAGGTQAPDSAQTGGQQGGGTKTPPHQQLAGELHRVTTRHERLKAD